MIPSSFRCKSRLHCLWLLAPALLFLLPLVGNDPITRLTLLIIGVLGIPIAGSLALMVDILPGDPRAQHKRIWNIAVPPLMIRGGCALFAKLFGLI